MRRNFNKIIGFLAQKIARNDVYFTFHEHTKTASCTLLYSALKPLF